MRLNPYSTFRARVKQRNILLFFDCETHEIDEGLRRRACEEIAGHPGAEKGYFDLEIIRLRDHLITDSETLIN